MPAPAARIRSASVPCGTISSSILPARYSSSNTTEPTLRGKVQIILRTRPSSISRASPAWPVPALLATQTRSRRALLDQPLDQRVRLADRAEAADQHGRPVLHAGQRVGHRLARACRSCRGDLDHGVDRVGAVRQGQHRVEVDRAQPRPGRERRSATAATAWRRARPYPPAGGRARPAGSAPPGCCGSSARPPPAPNGQRCSATSCRISTKMPPSPNSATGPNTGSRWMPRMHSTPPLELLGDQHALDPGAGRRVAGALQQRWRTRPAPRPRRRRRAARRRSPTCAGCRATGSSSPPGSRTAPRRRPPRRPWRRRPRARSRSRPRPAGASPPPRSGVGRRAASTGAAPAGGGASGACGEGRRRSGPWRGSPPPRGSGPRTPRTRPPRSRGPAPGRATTRQHVEPVRMPASRTPLSCSRSRGAMVGEPPTWVKKASTEL